MLFRGRDKSVPTASWAWKRLLRYMVVLVFIAGFATLLWPKVNVPQEGTPIRTTSNITISSNVKCDLDVDVLKNLHVHKVAEYIRREIVVDFTEDELPMRQKVDQPLLDVKAMNTMKENNVNVLDESHDGCSIPIPMTVQVPKPPKMVDASHIDFGVATTVERLNDSLDAFAHWAGYTRTRIFAHVEPGEGIDEVKAKADALGVNLIVEVSEDDFLWRYFALIPLLNANARAQTQWACIIDDDTFFMSMPALVQAFRGYNHNERMYVGGISEGAPQIGLFGIMAFGGAGVFMSRPLLSDLADMYDDCKMMGFEGDRRIAYCIYQNTATRLTINHRLRQLDLMDDASGFFESGREPPLSVHHWKSWFHMDMAKLSAVSELCGDTCLLRQWRFSDSWTLTNGYSVVRYSFPPELNDTSIETTWESSNGATDVSYLHELGPLRRKDDEKASYLLQDSVLQPDGRVTQWYIMQDLKNGDRILELTWRKR